MRRRSKAAGADFALHGMPPRTSEEKGVCLYVKRMIHANKTEKMSRFRYHERI